MTDKKCPKCGSRCFQIVDYYATGYIYEVDIGALAEFLVSFLAAIDGCRRQAGITEILLTSLSTSLNIIAKSNNLSAWNVRKTLDGTRSTHA